MLASVAQSRPLCSTTSTPASRQSAATDTRQTNWTNISSVSDGRISIEMENGLIRPSRFAVMSSNARTSPGDPERSVTSPSNVSDVARRSSNNCSYRSLVSLMLEPYWETIVPSYRTTCTAMAVTTVHTKNFCILETGRLHRWQSRRLFRSSLEQLRQAVWPQGSNRTLG